MTCPACDAENEPRASACIACGEPLGSPSPSMATGAVFAGRYEILGALGRGGMGMVYRARDHDLGENVALKMIRPDLARQQHIEQRFRSEIKLARRVRHPNVCSIYGDGEDHGLLYICMELVDGTDLRELVRARGPFPTADAFDVALQIAEGLTAIHEVGIIHRDLKTANIMRDGRGVVRLMDFGIAKKSHVEGTTGATATGQVLGTPEYMSPEQIRGQRVDFRTDVYALGVVIYEIFTGSVPFRGDSPVATIFKHLQEPARLRTRGPRALPRSLVPVLRRALEKEPAARFASAREMLEALRRARDEYHADPDPVGGTTSSDAPDDAPTVDEDATTVGAGPTRPWSGPPSSGLETDGDGATTDGARRPARTGRQAAALTIAAVSLGGVWLWSRSGPTEPAANPAAALATAPPVSRPSPPASTPTREPAAATSPAPSTMPPPRSSPPPRSRDRPLSFARGNVGNPSVSPAPPTAPPTPRGAPGPAIIYNEDDADVSPKPVKLAGQSAEYPQDAIPLTPGQRVSVVASFVVTESGDVTDFDITIEGSNAPGNVRLAVVAAYSKWKFSPGRVNGVPVRVRIARRQTFLGG